MVVHAYNPSNWEIETGGSGSSGVQGHPVLTLSLKHPGLHQILFKYVCAFVHLCMHMCVITFYDIVLVLALMKYLTKAT